MTGLEDLQQEQIRVLEEEVNDLKMTNQLLIAELGMIATALDVEPSMVKVLARIKELKDRT